ncbi:STAS domain-containing protein [Novipirellula artificiosorum]|uniref:STAS domain-containing protein n=1 Tax=Novipirellula artificiosorum TaxID=2528016 RepID=A0A5C6D7U1_9BACT|nr:STAS domain-containing protein [Novipirellula artificiosorum]TWU33002.1 hypothetical protein Poly41_53810 [Novipirellula artificiosorum]
MKTYTHLRISAVEGVPIVTLTATKYIDRLLIQETQDELLDYIRSAAPKRLVISFEEVQSISSEFITTMLRCSEYVRSEEGELRLSCMSPVVRMAFKVTNLDGTLLGIAETNIKAIDSFPS